LSDSFIRSERGAKSLPELVEGVPPYPNSHGYTNSETTLAFRLLNIGFRESFNPFLGRLSARPDATTFQTWDINGPDM
jgi:hypothetical protein